MKLKTNRKLELKKESLRKLTPDQLEQVNGGLKIELTKFCNIDLTGTITTGPYSYNPAGTGCGTSILIGDTAIGPKP